MFTKELLFSTKKPHHRGIPQAKAEQVQCRKNPIAKICVRPVVTAAFHHTSPKSLNVILIRKQKMKCVQQRTFSLQAFHWHLLSPCSTQDWRRLWMVTLTHSTYFFLTSLTSNYCFFVGWDNQPVEHSGKLHLLYCFLLPSHSLLSSLMSEFFLCPHKIFYYFAQKISHRQKVGGLVLMN